MNEKLTPEQISEENHEKMMMFVNAVRVAMHESPIEALPERAGPLARNSPISQALGVSIIRHQDQGMMYGLCYSREHAVALVQAGGNSRPPYPRCWSKPHDGQIIEVNLPRYCYEWAG